MAKASTRRETPAEVKPAPPAAAAKNAKKAGAKQAATKKPAAPQKAVASKKMAQAQRKSPKQTAGGRAVTPPKSVANNAPARKAARKAAPPAKVPNSVAMKKAAARRPLARTAVPTPAARRARTAAVPRKPPTPPSPKIPAAAKPAQSFTVSHLNENDFKTDGLRAYARYRDLGIAAATGGLCQAHVIRFTPPCTDEVRKRHAHEADLQRVYVLQGWMKNEFEGHGEQMMSAGSCWLQPSGIKHTVLDYSADCEVLEIIVPADFKTDELI